MSDAIKTPIAISASINLNKVSEEKVKNESSESHESKEYQVAADQASKKDYLAKGAKAYFSKSNINNGSEEKVQKKSSQSYESKENTVIERKPGEETELFKTIQEEVLKAMSNKEWDNWEKNDGVLSLNINFLDQKTTK